ncbi:MAG: fluoride efflux transporter CrcB [Rhodobiaceae bacterium]|nr:fluoride efflux transporter CrcB [Rhodobiaceae bacterium]
MNTVFYVAIGGALGASARHLVGLAALRLFGAGFPWGTITVNIVGSLLMGLFIEALAVKFDGSTAMRALIATGFLGGFTTFSSFSLDVAVLWERGEAAIAATYVVASVVLAIAALFAGLTIGRSVF